MKVQIHALILVGTILQTTLLAQVPVVEPWKVGRVKMRVQQGKKAKEIKVVLQYSEGRLEIHSVQKGLGTVVTSLPYAEIEGADYSFSKHRRIKSGVVLAVATGVLAAPMFFLKGKKHWLTIRAKNDVAFLRLDKNAHERVRAEFTANTEVPVGVLGLPTKPPHRASQGRDVGTKQTIAQRDGAPPSRSDQTSLKISSDPEGAEIEIDGAYVGNTPRTRTVQPGEHMLGLRKKGYAPWERKIAVEAGETLEVAAELEAN